MRGKLPKCAMAVLCLLWLGLGWHPWHPQRPAASFASQGGTLPCGAAAMLAFASHYGNDTVIRMRAILSDNGGMSRPLATFADLADWARGAGLQLHGLRVDAQGAEHLPVPWIAHLNPGHFVVVWDMARDHATISDQLHDHQQVPRQEFDRLFSGNALCDRGARPNGLLRHLDFVRR